mgnify:CR=1 FL=1|tara:strand:+ start:155 stop:667 length:513 start_codon:yes stop_codon:yes gene_type:complete
MSKYKIKLNGLKDGSYINSFRIRGEFFETLNSSEIKLVDIDIDTMLKVENRRYNLEIKSNGMVIDIPCDICTEKINIPISSEINYIIKKGIGKDLEDENVIFVDEKDKELILDSILYEMIVLAFPTKRQHQLNSINDEECNKEMVNLINKYSVKENNNIDPRWEALKKLK